MKEGQKGDKTKGKQNSAVLRQTMMKMFIITHCQPFWKH